MSFFSRGETRLSLRLKKLQQLQQGTEVIWDIGCDHGLLGTSFLTQPEIKKIHLVDPSEEVINKLRDTYITNEQISIHHGFGQSIELDKNTKTIYIAGMGGKEIKEIILNLIPQLSETDQLIISPHRKILELRKFLENSPLRCAHEEVIEEANQYYQILSLTLKKNYPEVSPFGDGLWESVTGTSYRRHQIQSFSLHKDVASVEYVRYLRGLTG
ncbi:MAG TPA: tRNA (adenine(22)-N(1))-methyltransferase TrmK [Bacteriovoracaceae bacterium]|nr:tRNA (adenine(22)-N(1))-methyltransferase TrmK [Bacteriovoracaceae bacterium]